MVAQVLDSDLKDDIDVVELPSLNGKKATIIHGLGNCIYKDTKYPEAAWKWVEFLSGETANKLSAEMGAAIPKKATIIHGLGNCIYKDTKYPEAAWKWVEFLSGETANKLSAEMGAAIPALKGTAQEWIDKNPTYNLKSFITSSEEYSYPYPASVNTAEWEQYQADNLKKAAQEWIDKNPTYNLKSFITSSEEYSYPYPASVNTAEWEQYQADNLKKAFSLEVSVEDACKTLTEQMNEVLANE